MVQSGNKVISDNLEIGALESLDSSTFDRHSSHFMVDTINIAKPGNPKVHLRQQILWVEWERKNDKHSKVILFEKLINIHI